MGGTYYQQIVDLQATLAEAEPLANRVRDWLIKEGIIQAEATEPSPGKLGHAPGPRYFRALKKPEVDRQFSPYDVFQLMIGRTVFFRMEQEYTCAKCGALFDPDQEKSESGGSMFIRAVNAWYAGDDEASFPCPSCGHVELLTRWDGPLSWAFGHLGFSFWDWPDLSPGFVQEVSRALGHRVRLIDGVI